MILFIIIILLLKCLEYSLEGPMLKLKLQYFGHLMWRTNSLEKTLMLGKIEGKRSRRQKRVRWLDSITDSMEMNLSKLQEIIEDRGAWRAAVQGVEKSGTWLQFSSVQSLSPTLYDPMNCSTPGLPVHHQFPEFTQTHIHRVSDAIQPSHPLLSPSPPAPYPSQHQSLFQWVNSWHEVAKVLEFQL